MNEKLKQFYNNTFRKQDFNLTEQSKAQIKDKIFANLGMQLPVVNEPVSAFARISSMLFKTYVLVPLVVVLFITGTTAAASDALPGDTLYPVKLQVENAQVLLAPTEEAKLDLQVTFAQKRLEEVELVKAKEVDQNHAIIVNNEEEDKASRNTSNTDSEDNREKDDKKIDDSKSRRIQRTAREIKASEQADNAIRFLDGARKQFEDRGKNDRAQKIQAEIKKYRSEWGNNDDNRDDQNRRDRGSVEGIDTNIRIESRTFDR